MPFTPPNTPAYAQYDANGYPHKSVLAEFFSEDEYGPVADWDLTDTVTLNALALTTTPADQGD